VSEPAETFDGFVLARGPHLLRFAYSLVGDRGLAEDLVQEALVKVSCVRLPSAARWRLLAGEPDPVSRTVSVW